MHKLDYNRLFIDNMIDLYSQSNSLIVIKYNLIVKNENEDQSNLINY